MAGYHHRPASCPAARGICQVISPVTQDATRSIGVATPPTTIPDAHDARGRGTPNAHGAPTADGAPASNGTENADGESRRPSLPTAQADAGCTQAQLRRFIKSRPYVPMHELRRRFELNGQADDVTPIASGEGVIYVGLPSRESVFMAELLRQGDIGVELCRDPSVPIVVGVYAIRPVSR